MNVNALPSRFSLSTFHSPIIAVVTIIAYLNLVFFQLSSAVAMEDRNSGSHKTSGIIIKKSVLNDEGVDLRLAPLASLQPETVKKEGAFEAKRTSLFSSWMSSAQDLAKMGRSTALNVASHLSSAIRISPIEAQFLSYFATTYLMNDDYVGSIMKLGVTYMVCNAVYQFAKMQRSSWFGYSSAEQDSQKVRKNSIHLNSLRTTLLSAFVLLSYFATLTAATMNVTNQNQNLTGTINGPPVFFQPIEIFSTIFFCEALFILENYPYSGNLITNVSTTVKPSWSHGEWLAAGNCTDVRALVNGLALYIGPNYTLSPITIHDSFSNGLNRLFAKPQDYVLGLINVFLGPPTPTPSPTTTVTPTPSPTGTFTPTPSPTGTFTPTPSPTVTFSPTPSPTGTFTPTPSPTVTFSPTPSPTATFSPTPSPSPTGSPSPSPFPTSSPTPVPSPSSSLTPFPTSSPTPFPSPTISPTSIPTSPYDYTPIIIIAAVAGALLTCCCVWGICLYCKKDKKKKKDQPEHGAQPLGETSALIQND